MISQCKQPIICYFNSCKCVHLVSHDRLYSLRSLSQCRNHQEPESSTTLPHFSLLSGRTHHWMSSHGAVSPPSPLPPPLSSVLWTCAPQHPPGCCGCSRAHPAGPTLCRGVERAHGAVSETLQCPPRPGPLRHRGEPTAALPGTGERPQWSVIPV